MPAPVIGDDPEANSCSRTSPPLLDAEHQKRAKRRERRRLIDARFPISKRLEEFRLQGNPKVRQATIAALAHGSWIDDRESSIFHGESGSGNPRGDSARGVRLPPRPTRALHDARRARERAP